MRPRATSPEAVLIEVLDRVAGSRDHTIRISARELAGWPVDAVAALKSQRLLRRSRPATSVVCPGCEQQCGMPVYTVVGPGASAGQTDRWSFVVCDKRSDINRVTVEPDRLTRWQSSPDAVCDFVADCLGLRPSGKRIGRAGLMEIGMANGRKRRQMLCLRADGELELVAGEGALALAEVIDFNRGHYGLKTARLRRFVDTSAMANARYTPSRTGWAARKRAIQARDHALERSLPAAETGTPGHDRHLVRPAARQARLCRWPQPGNHPQEDITTGTNRNTAINNGISVEKSWAKTFCPNGTFCNALLLKDLNAPFSAGTGFSASL